MNPWKKVVLENGEIHLEIFLTRRCNLKCKNCTFYCNINKFENEVLYPLEQVEKDLKHLILIGVKIKSICIIGGEPTMIKNLTDYFYAIRRSVNPETIITVFTNTVSLVNLCNSKGIKALKDTGIGIVYTNYMGFVNAKNLLFLKSFGIIISCIGNFKFKTSHDNLVQNVFNKQTLFPSDFGDSKKEEHFEKCECDILSMCDGRIYTCGRSLNIKFLNKKFGFNYPEDSYIEVSSLTSADELIEFSKKSGKLCSFCANVDPENAVKVPWSREPAEVTDYK